MRKDDDQGLGQISRLLDRRVDGLILWPSFAVAYYEHFKRVARAARAGGRDRSRVFRGQNRRLDRDGRTAMRQGGGRALVSLGHENIACLSSRETAWQAWAVRRRESFEALACTKRKFEMTSWRLNQWGTDGLEVAEEILTQDPRPTAVFSVTDHEALFVLRSRSQFGAAYSGRRFRGRFRRPGLRGRRLRPPLTTMRQRPKDMGRRAAQLVSSTGLMAILPTTRPRRVRVGAT